MGLLAWLGLDGEDDDATVDMSRRALFREAQAPIRKVREELETLPQTEPDVVGPLRPPGALPESEFRQACTQCRECIEACPHDALFIDDDGFPTFRMNDNWCRLGDETPCIAKCPTEALKSSPLNEILRIGTVEIDHDACLSRTSFCSVCRERCPVEAISIRRGRVLVDAQTCYGCGECVYRCPAPTQALRIVRL